MACAALVAAALCLWLRVSRNGPPEPVYEGKPLGYWLKLGSRSSATVDDRIAEEKAVRAADTSAIPFLVAKFERDATWGSREDEYNRFAAKLHLPAALTFTNTAAYAASAQALQMLGYSAKPGLLEIFEETSSTDALNTAAQTLYVSQGFTFGGRIYVPGVNTWADFVKDQKGSMSPKAWARLTNAFVFQYRF